MILVLVFVGLKIDDFEGTRPPFEIELLLGTLGPFTDTLVGEDVLLLPLATISRTKIFRRCIKQKNLTHIDWQCLFKNI